MHYVRSLSRDIIDEIFRNYNPKTPKDLLSILFWRYNTKLAPDVEAEFLKDLD